MPVHVLFQMLGHYFGVKAQEIMSWFLLISACFLEFLGSFFLLLSRKFTEPGYESIPNGYTFTQPVHNEPTQATQPVQTAITQHDKQPVALPTQQWQYPQLSDFTKKA